jgi:murein L,D-transpeptidase YcbB/YkuD
VDPSTIDWDSHADEGQREEEEQDEEKEEEDEEDEQDGQEFPYRFRQRPGTRNSLGLVKFLFPNAFDVYLHDTPAGSLFGRSFRALSHGCVRLEQPVKLAEYLLGHDPKWDTERIQQAMHHGEEEHVKLPRPVAVHLMYWTARVDENGDVSFFRDIYRHDARQWSDYQARIARVKKQKAELRNAEITRGSRPASSGGAARPAGGE